jgi:preprotein translocase subunit SecE
VGAYVAELFKANLYKRNQGKVARQVTFAALAIIVLLGAWRLNVWLDGRFDVSGRQQLEYVIPLVLVAVGLWACFRLVQMPKFADFLIHVEGEMGKVTWPKQQELIRASAVVLIVIFFLAAILFAYDFVWRALFGWLLN